MNIDSRIMKRIAAALTAAGMLLALAACGQTAATTTAPPEKKTPETTAVPQATAVPGTDAPPAEGAKAKGDQFVVGFDANFPPYGYLEDGEYKGFDLSLAEEVCKRRGWELVKRPIDWDAKDMELTSGSIDCIWNGFTINGREGLYAWTPAYVDNSQVFVVRSDSGIAKQADLAGKVVVVQADSSALAALEDEENEEAVKLTASFAKLEQVPDYNTAFMNLESGAVDAVAMDIGVAHYQIDKREAGAYVILEDELVQEEYGIGFKLDGGEALRDQVWETVLEMMADGTFVRIADEYGLGEAIKISK